MKQFELKTQGNIVITIITIYVFMLAFSLMTTLSGYDMLMAVQYQDLALVTSLHPFLPLSRAIMSLLSLQYFDAIGGIEIISTIVLLISSFSVEFIMLLILLWLLIIYNLNPSPLRRWVRFNLILICLSITGFIALFTLTCIKAFFVFFFMTGNALTELSILQFWYIYGGYGMVLYLILSLAGSFYIYRKRPI